MTRKMTKKEAAEELRALAYEIYDTLKEMENILKEVAPEELTRARVYWMAHIDGCLLNHNRWMGRSFINLEDTLLSLELDEEEEEEEVQLLLDMEEEEDE